jgi:hypothetical protein
VKLRPLSTDGAWDVVRRELDTWARDLRAMIDGGLRLRDQLRGVREVVGVDVASLPIVIEVPRGVVPLAVVLVRATQRGSSIVVSGGAVTWDAEPTSAIRVHSFAALPSGIYDVTLAVVE